jgi:hypothetical protein
MADCPTCEYHKQRAQIWRDEAYRLAGHPLPRKETMIDFLYTDARWTEHFVEVSDPHKEGHHVRFYFEPPQDKLIVKLTEMLEIQQKLHETTIDMIKPAIEAEREACAEICDRFQARDVGMQPAECAGAIRARGQA